MKKRLLLFSILFFFLTACGAIIEIDLQLPDVTGLSAVPGDEKVMVTWDNLSYENVSHFQIYYNWQSKYESLDKDSSAKEITGLTNNYPYKIILYIVDENGNRSQGTAITFIPTANSSYQSDASSLPVGFGFVSGKVMLDKVSDYTGIKVQVQGTDIITETNKGGFYEIKLPIGPYSGLTFSKAGYTTSNFSKAFIVEERKNNSFYSLTLTQVTSINGCVMIKDTTDYSNAQVMIMNTLHTTTTTEDGAFEFNNISPGTYTIRVSYGRFTDVVINNIQLDRGQIVQLPDVWFGLKGSVKGRIVLQGLLNYEGATVGIPNTIFTTVTGPDGTFTISDVVVGTYDLVCSKPGYVTTNVYNLIIKANEETDARTINLLDQIAPVTWDNSDTTWQNQNMDLRIEASDTGSGVNKIEYEILEPDLEIIKGTGKSQVNLDVVKEGITKITYSAYDNAENISLTKTIEVKIDKQAEITSIYEDSNNKFKGPGETIYFQVVTGEDTGNVQISLGDAVTGLELINRGDGTGIYELTYTVPENTHVHESEVTATFIDRAGNTVELTSPTASVTIVSEKTSTDFATKPISNVYLLENNTWGTEEDDTIGDYTQTIAVSEPNKFPCYWEWDWPTANGLVKGYPELAFGQKPWGMEISTTTKLPIELANIQNIYAAYDIKHQAVGKYNVSYDLWVIEKDAPIESASITDEIMIWMNYTEGNVPAGTKKATLTIDNEEFDLYQDAFTKDDLTWSYLAFIRKNQGGSYQIIDIAKFITYLSENGYLTDANNKTLASVEFGTEIISGQGQMTVNNYTVQVVEK
ncbi:carboxypeptidase regulatory-like domain-containing protein [Candidatus Margulisiibacteriota bacterium]